MTDDMSENNENWQSRAEAAEAALSRVQSETEIRVIKAELKAEAIKAGMVDLDGLKLLELSHFKLNGQGELDDSAQTFQKLKRSKPWLFSGSASSSAAANPPRPETVRARHANELSHEEWLAARAALTRRR
jgi:hypothetical protein